MNYLRMILMRFACILLIWGKLCNSVVMREYNKVNFEAYSKLDDLKSSLFDTNGKATTNIVLLNPNINIVVFYSINIFVN